MDRLTFEGDFCTIAMCQENPCPYDNSCTQREVWERLKAYEDTRLEPEVCAEYKKFEDEAVSKGVPFKRVVELLEAEKGGRLVVLPCKVGDTVYRVVRRKGGGGHISPAVVIGIHMADTVRGHRYQKGTEYVVLRVDGYYCDHVDVKKFGKTVFLDREGAEAALKGGAK